MIGFTFKGIDSEEYGVIVETPPDIPVGVLRSQTQKIGGRSKLLHFIEGEGAIEPVTLTLECALLRPDDDAVNQVAAWLTGGGDLVIPGDEDHSYRAWVKSQIDLKNILRARSDRRFTVQFECEGLKYRYPPAAAIRLTAPRRVNNPGTAAAEPLITLYGSGNVSLLVGESTLMIDGVTDYVMIDCAAQLVYREEQNLGASVTRVGDWPVIPVGGCLINWTGGVTRVEILPRWRDR